MPNLCDMNSREQFGRTASAYATSTNHAVGADGIVDFLDPPATAIALDVATGAGHTAHALARHCRYVLATDITPEMLTETRQLASKLELANVDAGLALAEALPYADESFDAVTCRIAAHHFQDVAAFCRELQRVLKRGGRAVIHDSISPEDDAVSTFVNDVELRRDPSHVCDWKVSDWRRFFTDADLEVVELRESLNPEDHELADWTERAKTPPEQIEYVRRAFETASPDVIASLGLHRQGETFVWGWPRATILLRRP